MKIECTPEEFKELFNLENQKQTHEKSLTINGSGGLKSISDSKQNIHDIFTEFQNVDKVHVEVSDTFVC